MARAACCLRRLVLRGRRLAGHAREHDKKPCSIHDFTSDRRRGQVTNHVERLQISATRSRFVNEIVERHRASKKDVETGWREAGRKTPRA